MLPIFRATSWEIALQVVVTSGLLVFSAPASAQTYGSSPNVWPTSTMVGKVTTFSDFFGAGVGTAVSFDGTQVNHYEFGGPSQAYANSSFSWSLSQLQVESRGIVPFSTVFTQAGHYTISELSSYQYTVCQSGYPCTQMAGDLSTRFFPVGAIDVADNPSTVAGTTPGNPLTPAAGSVAVPVPPLTLPAYGPPRPDRFIAPRTSPGGGGVRGITLGENALFIELPKGDAYTLQVDPAGLLFAGVSVGTLPEEGMSLHLFDGSPDVKLSAGTAYYFTDGGVSAFSLLGDPDSLTVGLLFHGDENSVLSDVYANSFSAAIPEPSSYWLVLAGLGLLGILGPRRYRGKH